MDGSGISEVVALFSSTFGAAMPAVLGLVFGGYSVLLIVRAIKGSVR